MARNKKEKSIYDKYREILKKPELSEEEKQIGVLIIGNLDDDGYLRIPLQDVTRSAEADLRIVHRVLSKIQEFDPVGVGARDLSECLLLQAKSMALESTIVEEMILHHLKDLENNNYPLMLTVRQE